MGSVIVVFHNAWTWPDVGVRSMESASEDRPVKVRVAGIGLILLAIFLLAVAVGGAPK